VARAISIRDVGLSGTERCARSGPAVPDAPAMSIRRSEDREKKSSGRNFTGEPRNLQKNPWFH
jgi:hypothetical protein